MKSYREVYAGKWRLPTANDSELQSLPAKKRGKPLLLGDKVDKAVQLYILKFHEQGVCQFRYCTSSSTRYIVDHG